jgi:hypothetical protein
MFMAQNGHVGGEYQRQLLGAKRTWLGGLTMSGWSNPDSYSPSVRRVFAISA